MEAISKWLNDLSSKFQLNLNGPGAILLAGVIGFILFLISLKFILSGTVATAAVNTIISFIFVILSAPALKYLENLDFNAFDFSWSWFISRIGSIVFVVATLIIYIFIADNHATTDAIFIPGIIYFTISWTLSSGLWMYNNGHALFKK